MVRGRWLALLLGATCATGALTACGETPDEPEPRVVVQEGSVAWTVHGLTREAGCGLASVRACLANVGEIDLEVTARRFDSDGVWQLIGPTPPFTVAAGEDVCFEGRRGPGTAPAVGTLAVDVAQLETPLSARFETPACDGDLVSPVAVAVDSEVSEPGAACGWNEADSCLFNRGSVPVTATDLAWSGDPLWQLAELPPLPAVVQPDGALCARLRLREPAPGVREGTLEWSVDAFEGVLAAPLTAECSVALDVEFPSEPVTWEAADCNRLEGRVCLRNDAASPLPLEDLVFTQPDGWSWLDGSLASVEPGETRCFGIAVEGRGRRSTEVRLHVPQLAPDAIAAPLSVDLPTGHTYRDTFTLPERPPVDLVWLVDADPAFDDAASVGAIATSLITSLQGTDARIAVAGSDPEDAGALLVPAEGTSPFVRADAPDAASRLAALAAQVDTADTWNETLTKAAQAVARLGATSPDGQPLGRDDALVTVLVTAASDDGSPAAWETLAEWVQQARRESFGGAVRMDVLAGAAGEGGTCTPVAIPRLAGAAAATGGTAGSLCEQPLDPLADRDWVTRTRFRLSRSPAEPPVLEVFRVQPDGTSDAIDAGDWSFDGATGLLTLSRSAAPAAGETLEVRYPITCPEMP